MKTVEIKVYSFSELSDESKQHAIDEWYTHGGPDWIGGDIESTLDKFCDIFNVRYRNIDFLEPYRFDYRISIDKNIEDMTGVRLLKYIWNNYGHYLYKGKYYGKLSKYFADGTEIPVSKQNPAGYRHIKRYSKCLLDNSCTLTGTYYDMDVLQPFYEFLDRPNTTDTLRDLIEEGIDKLCKSVANEWDAYYEFDVFGEHSDANQYEYTEDGERF